MVSVNLGHRINHVSDIGKNQELVFIAHCTSGRGQTFRKYCLTYIECSSVK